jgi:hypothetical protein
MQRAVVCAGLILCGVLSWTAGPSQGQTKTKVKPPALAYDAAMVRYDEKKGAMTHIYYETSPEDNKKLGIGKADTPITKNTKFVYVGTDGEKKFNQKTVLADADAKAALEKGKQVRMQVTALEVEELRFGPELKPAGPKRVR